MPNYESQAAGKELLEWYAVYTRHQHEGTVAALLHNKEIESFLPCYPLERQWADRRKTIQAPLFPGYVFAHTDARLLLPIMQTAGVIHVVSSAGRPLPIPTAEIEAIRRAVVGRLRMEPCPFLSAGDRVRVASGPLKGVEGILLRKESGDRLVLSIGMLQRSVLVQMSAWQLEPFRLPADSPNRPVRRMQFAAGGSYSP